MSLVDFDDDGGGFNTTTTTTTSVSFNGHTSNIDDPFGFDVFETGSKAATASADSAFSANTNADNFFDAFDPLATFGDGGTNGRNANSVITTTTIITSSNPSSLHNKDQFDMFGGDDFTSNNPNSVNSFETTTTNTHSKWVDGGFDDGAAHDFGNKNGHFHDNKLDNFEDDDKFPASQRESSKRNQDWQQEKMDERDFDESEDQERYTNDSDYGRRSDRNASSDPFFDDFKGERRGRINIDEIRQRSYEDMDQMNHSSYHDRNKKDQKTMAEKTPTVYVLGAAADNICKVCAKRVYEMEKITADLQVYHKSCFRCNHCNRILSLGNFSANEGRLYCKPHFIEIFKTKGNYKESFALAERLKHDDGSRRNDLTDDEDHISQSSRNQSEDYGNSRTRNYSGRDGDFDEYDAFDGMHIKEDIPVVPIKSVRSIFENLSHDQPPASVGQQKKQQSKTSSQSVHNEIRGRSHMEQVSRARSDSLKSDSDSKETHESVERRDSGSEIVQSSTTCIIEDELPPPSFTKSMLAKFKMMEDTTAGSKTQLNFGKPVSSKPASTITSANHHQTLSYQSSAGSQVSNGEESQINKEPVLRTQSKESTNEDREDELPQAGLAKSLLAQWRNIEEQSRRGRSRDAKPASSARRSQSMSRVETVQRANVLRNIDLKSETRAKQAEDLSYSDQEAGEDDLSNMMPTRRNLAKFKELEGTRLDDSSKNTRRFKWQVKEATPLNRGGLIVHGDVPKRPTAEETAAAAEAAKWSENVNEDVLERGRRDSSMGDARSDELDFGSNEIVQNSTITVINEDELPPPATTRTLLQKFKSMEDVTKAPPLPRPAPAVAAREAESRKIRSVAPLYADDNYDADGANQINAVGYDYSPNAMAINNDDDDEYVGNGDMAYDHDVVKESDRFDEVEMPAEGTTRSLLAKFQSLQAKR